MDNCKKCEQISSIDFPTMNCRSCHCKECSIDIEKCHKIGRCYKLISNVEGGEGV